MKKIPNTKDEDQTDHKCALKAEGSIIVLADTHLGLNRKKIPILERVLEKIGEEYFLGNSIDCEPLHLQQLINWLEELQSKGKQSGLGKIKLGRWGSDGEQFKKLVFNKSSKLVLLGDIIELWDASDRAIDLCSNSVMNSILRLECDKIYTIGNHDFAMKQYSKHYPSGQSVLELVEDVYPDKKTSEDEEHCEGAIKTMKVGEDHYLFMHGQQISTLFSKAKSAWKLIPLFRDGAETFRLYSWIILVAFFISVIMNVIPNSINNWYLTSILGILAFPKIFASIARPIWNQFYSHRYKIDKSGKGFIKWWEDWAKEKKYPDLKIVFGHTHKLDLDKIKKDNREIELINIPAWVVDYEQKHRTETRAVFLYIDSKGYEFIGWDYGGKKPFYIPKDFIEAALKERQKKFVKDHRKELEEIGWSEKYLYKLENEEKWLEEEYRKKE